MAELQTTYLGLQLKNPILAASSGLTNSLSDIQEFESHGAAAVVLKSVFEEEIRIQLEKGQEAMSREAFIYPETLEFYEDFVSDDSLTSYLGLISEAKKNVSIPIIASVNCVSSDKWPYYAQYLEDAGADALEFNIFMMPSDFDKSCEEIEKNYFQIVEAVKQYVRIPISLKISFYANNLGSLIQQLSHSGIAGMVLFNRFYSPDLDINQLKILSTNVLSNSSEISMPLRWIGIMSERVGCDLAASTGIHDGEGVIKQLLAGAQVVQVASTVYRNGKSYITTMIKDVETWMDKMKYKNLSQFRGLLSTKKSENPAAYYRMQFMKHFAGKHQQ